MRSSTRRWLLLTMVLAVGLVALWLAPTGPSRRRAAHRPFTEPDPQNQPSVRRPQDLRVLFVGNSFTNHNGGLALIVRRMAEAALAQGRATRPPMFEQSTESGMTLQWHWEQGAARRRIAEGNWDYVVLQEQSERPLNDPAAFERSVRLFDGEIRGVGARTVLFMTWPTLKGLQRGEGEAIAKVYEQVGRSVGADVVPVGRAFVASTSRRPELALYAADGKHPTAEGSYLAGCCFFRYFYGPEAVPYPLPLEVRDDGGWEWVGLSKNRAIWLWAMATEAARPRPTTAPATTTTTTPVEDQP